MTLAKIAKVIKILFWLFIVAFVGLIIYQNRHFLFFHREYVQLNLFLDGHHYITSEWPLGLYVLAFFVAGFLLAYFSTLEVRFSARKTIRGQAEEIEKLNAELEELRCRPGAALLRPQVAIEKPAAELAAPAETPETTKA